MLGKIRLQRPAPGTVLGGLALIVAMSGVAVAAIPGADKTVTVCIAKDGGVKAVDAEAGKTCQGSQTTAKLATTDARGKVADADMLDGVDSTLFLRRVVTRHGPEATFVGSSLPTSYAACGSGEKVVGGGYHLVDHTTNQNVVVNANRPSRAIFEPEARRDVYYAPADGAETATGWIVAITGDIPAAPSDGITWRTYVQCAS